MNLIKEMRWYFSPEARIARKLRSAAKLAGEHYYQIAFGQLSDRAREFEKCRNR